MISFPFTFSPWQLSTLLAIGLQSDFTWTSKILCMQEEPSRIPALDFTSPTRLFACYPPWFQWGTSQAGRGKVGPPVSLIPVSTMWQRLSNLLLQEWVIWQQSLLEHHWATRINTAVTQDWDKLFLMHIPCVHMVGCVYLGLSIIFTTLEQSFQKLVTWQPSKQSLAN